ncbi:MAG: NAD-dependent epimerase/dehydratase family protein [Lachnospiraceae bacterium]|nr:NAD-dependent epimerase/dehydratase family protein [Lachnospiraceae bacterium]
MKALVTGGAGFIGSNVVRKLLNEGWEVRILDNLSTGYIDNLDGLAVEMVQGDILDASTVNSVGGIDVVFHLAASVGRQRSIDYPQQDSTINLVGTINVLESMRKNHIPKIVYSSSAAIFGELMTPEIDELHPQNADSPYGVSKLAAEKMILSYAGIYDDISAVCLRYFNIYGVNQRFDMYGNVIPIFAHRLLNHQPILIYGDGTQTRDFVNVIDIANANFLAAESNIKSDVFNMGSGGTITIQKLAEMMQEISGIDSGIEYLPERKADVKHCKANASKANHILGFEAKVDLQDGLKSYWEWFVKNA